MTRRAVAFMLFAIIWGAVLFGQQRTVPIATAVEQTIAQIAINKDGSEITLRAALADSVRVCVEPKAFGVRRCYGLGDIRAGRVSR